MCVGFVCVLVFAGCADVRHAIRVDSPPVFRPGSGWKPTETTISNHAGGGSRATVASRNPAACAEKYSSVRPPHKESARVAKARRGGGQSTVSQPPHLRYLSPFSQCCCIPSFMFSFEAMLFLLLTEPTHVSPPAALWHSTCHSAPRLRRSSVCAPPLARAS